MSPGLIAHYHSDLSLSPLALAARASSSFPVHFQCPETKPPDLEHCVPTGRQLGGSGELDHSATAWSPREGRRRDHVPQPEQAR